jgi:hypothetical protein
MDSDMGNIQCFLQHTLRIKGLFDHGRTLIHIFTFGKSVAVKVDDDVSSYFQTKKLIKTRRSIIIILFNILVDVSDNYKA